MFSTITVRWKVMMICWCHVVKHPYVCQGNNNGTATDGDASLIMKRHAAQMISSDTDAQATHARYGKSEHNLLRHIHKCSHGAVVCWASASMPDLRWPWKWYRREWLIDPNKYHYLVCGCIESDCGRTFVRTYGWTYVFTGFIRSSLRWPNNLAQCSI